MSTTHHNYPSNEKLEEGLSLALKENGMKNSRITVVERRLNIHESTSTSEIVTCRTKDGNIFKFFCKYSHKYYTDHKHRGNVSYEAKVYRFLLEKLNVSTPKFIGVYEDNSTGDSWLIIENLEESTRFTKATERSSESNFQVGRTIKLAARWVGEFHKQCEKIVSNKQFSFLINYDQDYYGGWAKRTISYSRHLKKQVPWLKDICLGFKEMIPMIVSKPLTIIHGEYYPNNVLYQNGAIRPVDWESTAIALGEIDLASLTDGWPREIEQQCVDVYKSARWSEGIPVDFQTIYGFSQLYQQLRWLGDRPEWTNHESMFWRFEVLHSIGTNLKLI